MFDDYKDSQSIVYTMVKNSIKLDKVSHAYLIDSNNFSDIDNFITSFIKVLLCPNHYSNDDLCEGCNRCVRIENKNDPEVRYIYPDGLNIKKEQLRELQDEFNLSSIEGNRRVYVIRDCEKMNVQASNSILKFLEEPVSNVVAILVTSNIDALLPTIVSRCQYVKLNQNEIYCDKTLVNAEKLIKSCGFYDVDSDNIELYVEKAIDFVLFYEQNGYDTLIYMKKLWNDIFGDRSGYIIGMQLIIQLYYDILKYKLKGKICFYLDYEVKVVKVANLLSLDDVIRKVNIWIEYLELLKYNVNLNLFMDSLIIELGG